MPKAEIQEEGEKSVTNRVTHRERCLPKVIGNVPCDKLYQWRDTVMIPRWLAATVAVIALPNVGRLPEKGSATATQKKSEAETQPRRRLQRPRRSPIPTATPTSARRTCTRAGRSTLAHRQPHHRSRPTPTSISRASRSSIRWATTMKIDTPLDWAGVTDHSEYVGVIKLANEPGSPVSKMPAAQPLILKATPRKR